VVGGPATQCSVLYACEGTSPLLPDYGSQFNFALLKIANEFLKGVQATWPSHQLLKIARCLFATLFLEKSRQSLVDHFEAIAQREPVRPRDRPQDIFDLPRQLVFVVM
jgi:hypothetical protein